jgi:predicted component of type VI protein secretion system
MMYGLILLAAIFVGCSSNPHKAKEIDTSMESEEKLNQESSIGVKDGDMVYRKKVNMAEELRGLQISVYSLEDRVYGNRKYGSNGLYGVLKTCRVQVTSKANGGDGKLMWTEPIDRVTDKEEEFDIGLNKKQKIIGVSQEFLKDRIGRFREYKRVLQKREDEYKEKIEICQAKLKSQQFDMKKKASR